jgi:predicted Zn-dependent protease
MTDVQICWSRGISEAEASAVRFGVGDVLKYITLDLNVEVIGEACDADSWVERCRTTLDRGHGLQVDANCVLTEQIPDRLARSRINCLTVVIIEADITDGDNSFLFGGSLSGFGSILSVARLRDSTMSEKVLRRLARHEFGHALGLIPAARSTNVQREIGLHCTNVCTMRQAMSLQELQTLTAEEERTRIMFCPECADYLKNGLADLEML